MFIKIERVGYEAIYQCKSVEFHHLKPDDSDGKTPDENDPGGLIIVMDSSKVDIEIEKRDISVYLMNDSGKTIDSYTW